MKNLLEVRNLKKYFPIKGSLFQKGTDLKAVDDISFHLKEGTTMGLVGESGCGKSTLGRAILRLHEPTSGQVLLEGDDITAAGKKEMFKNREKMQIIFQDPHASLNPRMTIRDILMEPLNVHQIGTKRERQQHVEELIEVVGLRKQVLGRYPHEFSGGQRQRIGIARALTLKPKFIVADEAVSALDVSVQSQILNLIADLQKRFGIAFLFISHDLTVIHHISDEVGVMYLGKLVEKASADDIYHSPKHPYTQALLSAVPVADPEAKRERIILEGDVPSPINPPSGCSFHPRCPKAMDICKTKAPTQLDMGTEESEHLISCHLYS